MNAATPSPDLASANQRLLELRQQAKRQRPSFLSATSSSPSDDSLPQIVSELLTEPITATRQVAKLPPHLGWGSEPVTQVIRAALQHQRNKAALPEPLWADHLSSHPIIDGSYADGQPLLSRASSGGQKQQSFPLYRDTLRHYPSLGIAAMQQEQTAEYRVWLMGRYLDDAGKGWLPVQRLRERLAGRESKLQLCGWRRLRQILGQGHGRLWHWDKAQGRLWLFGAARVAANLGVARLVDRVVALPMTAVTGNIGEFKAHLYAAWHNGRKRNSPISRQVQETLMGIPERTQRHYCQVAHIWSQTNIAIGCSYSSEAEQKQAWQHGLSLPIMTAVWDAKRRYVAWHLPNSYYSPHQQTAVGRTRKINRKLVLLSALRIIARVKGISEMAEEIGMSRQGLQKALSTKGNPRLDNINAIMRAMGYQLMPHRLETTVG